MDLSKDQIHEIMLSIPSEWRYRWCGGGWCGCMGCSNVSGAVVSKGITKEQWKVWVAENPNPTPNEPYYSPELLELLKRSSAGKTCSHEELKDRLRAKFRP